jgi:nucleotide-binding universal stress UspA family protein
MYQKIMVPLDGSELAEQALQHAVELVKAFDCDLYLVQVVTTPAVVAVPYDISYQYSETIREASLNEAHGYINNLIGKYKEELKGKIHTKIIEGSVVDGLLDYAGFQNVDLIVMATHGRSGIGRWVFGSVAERILRASDCPVFLIRAKSET